MYPIFKRLIDFIIAGVALIVLSPFLLITAILIKLDSKGPVIFKQERLGKNGVPFKIWKFRSSFYHGEPGLHPKDQCGANPEPETKRT